MTSVLYDAPGPKARRRSRTVSIIVVLAVVAILAWVVLTLAAQGVFDAERWDVFNDPLVWLALLDGLWVTLQVAFYGAILAISLGIVLSLLRSSRASGRAHPDHRRARVPARHAGAADDLVHPAAVLDRRILGRRARARPLQRRDHRRGAALRARVAAARSARVRSGDRAEQPADRGSSSNSRRRSARCCRSSSRSWSCC